MSYELSFSEEFFTDETFPYDTEESKRPTSVWQAIISMPLSLRAEVGAKVFGLKKANLVFWLDSIEWTTDILDKVRETNTCSNLNSPVRVWIDLKGDYTLSIYE
jgi:hypothetical protein